MSKQSYSVAEARDQLASLIRRAEEGETVTVTRRGKPVARVLSEKAYRKLLRRKRRIDWGAIQIDTRGFKFDREEANAR
jgi:prevent-host-death family protein